MIKANVCCVPSVRRLHEMVAQSAKIVVLVDMVMVAKNANLVNIVLLHLMSLKPVPHAVLDGTNRTLDKQAAFHAHQENINMLKER